MLANLLADLRFALRQLRRSPAFALTAALTLALGIGANTAIFSLLDQALLRSLPVAKPFELVQLEGSGTVWEGSTSASGGKESEYFSYPMYRDLRDRDPAFVGVLAFARTQAALVHGTDAPRLVPVELLSGNAFTVLGRPPALGRTLLASDDTAAGAHPVAVLSYAFWHDNLHADPSVVGSTLSLNASPLVIVGVAAPGFHGAVWGESPALFVPLTLQGLLMPGGGKDRALDARTFRWLNLIARLQPGETPQTAERRSAPLWHGLRAEELKALGARSPRFVDDFLTRSRLLVHPAAGGIGYNRDQLRQPLLAVMGMAALVLLLATVNVGSLLLVRSSARVREFSLRYALGASGHRVVIQLLIEGLLLGLGGACMGLLLAPLAMRAIIAQLADSSGAAPFSAALDPRVLTFAILVTLVFSLFFSLAPAWSLRSHRLSLSMREAAATGTGGVLALRRLIVGLQFSLSLLLLVGAGLFVRSLRELRTREVGFTTAHLFTFGLSPDLAGYTDDRIPALRQALQDALATLPGVSALGITNDPELTGNDHGGNVTFQNYTPPPDTEVEVEKANISPGYLQTLNIPLIAGRNFTPADDAAHPAVAIIDRSLAVHLFGSPAKALGQRFQSGRHTGRPFDIEVVGIAGDHMHVDLHTAAVASVYQPLQQARGHDIGRELFFYLRSTLPPEQLTPAIRARVAGVDSTLALDDLRTMQGQIDNMLSNERLIALLAGSFGVLAALLAGVGLYGVLAFVTAARTREIGVRMALGATRGLISRLVLGDVLRMVLAGVLAGIPAALGLAHLLRSQLYGVSPTDPLSLLAAAALLALVALLAAMLPAHRAVSTNPTEALRTE